MNAKEFIAKYNNIDVTARNSGNNSHTINEDAFAESLRAKSIQYDSDEYSITINWTAMEYVDDPNDIENFFEEVKRCFTLLAKEENLAENVDILVTLSNRYAVDESDDIFKCISIKNN